MRRVIGHIRGNAVAYVALFFALGGVSYAAQDALRDQRGVIKPRHISTHAVHQRHIARGAVTAKKLDRKLRHRLGLDTQQPQDGLFVGQGPSPNSSQPVSVSVAWRSEPSEGGPGIVRVVITTDDQSSPCEFANFANEPSTFQQALGNWQFMANATQAGYGTFVGLGSFIDATHIEFAGGLIQSPDGSSCIAPQDLELEWESPD